MLATMKKLLLLITLTLCGWGVQAQGVKFEKGGFDEALAKVRAQRKGNKLLFVDIFTSTCGPCVMVNTKIFPTKEAGDFFNANFINLKINMLEGEGPEFCKKYKVSAVPTFLIIDENGEEVDRFVGASKDAAAFIQRAKQAMTTENSIRELGNAYEQEKSFASGMPYLRRLYTNSMPEEHDVITELFWMVSDEERYSPEFFRMLFRNTKFGDPVFNEILCNRFVAQQLLGDKELENFFTSMAYGHARESGFEPEATAEAIALMGAAGISPDNLTFTMLRVKQMELQNDIDGIIDYFEKHYTPSQQIYGYELTDLYEQASEEQKERIRTYFESAIQAAKNTVQLYENLRQRISEQ